MYTEAMDAQAYYAGKNIEILRRLTYLQKHGLIDSKVKFHKICSGFFPKLVKQLSQYLLGNGVTLPEGIKGKLGLRFDSTLQKMGIQALVDGVNWGFWNLNKLYVFRATEFVPLFDEGNGDLRAGIRFWRLAPDKPLFVELYEESGITKYDESENETLAIREEKMPYIYKIRTDGISSEIIDTENYSKIPIFPLWANELKRSELTPGMKSMVDAYDFINSDLADSITLIEGVYWAIKNYGGDSVPELVKEMEAFRAIVTEHGDSSGSDATSHVIEIPYQAKQAALDIYRKLIYSDFMGLDMDSIKGGTLTNVAINVAKSDLDLKADLFEWQCADFVHNLLNLIGVSEKVEAQFKRRSITNDTEMVTNIYTMRADLDHKTALELNPIIPDIMVDTILDRFALEQLGIDEDDGEEIDEVIEDEEAASDGGG